MRVRLRMIGRTRESWGRAAEAEYHKRLGPWLQVKIEELKAEVLKEGAPVEPVREREAERLLAGLDPRALRIALDAGGQSFDSAEFSTRVGDWLESGAPELVFLIGGAEGLAPSLLEGAHLRLSLSRMTFTHQMVRLFLLEQLYRACMIRAGRPYHR